MFCHILNYETILNVCSNCVHSLQKSTCPCFARSWAWSRSILDWEGIDGTSSVNRALLLHFTSGTQHTTVTVHVNIYHINIHRFCLLLHQVHLEMEELLSISQYISMSQYCRYRQVFRIRAGTGLRRPKRNLGSGISRSEYGGDRQRSSLSGNSLAALNCEIHDPVRIWR